MHSDKVPYFILDLLQQVPSVYVPGLGRFEAIFHPAVIDLQQAQIKPPYIQPDFIAHVETEADMLPSYLHYVTGVDTAEAKETIASFVSDVWQHINVSESYAIEKFGTFSKSSSDVLHFTPDWDAFNLSFSGLEIIDLLPLTEQKTEVQAKTARAIAEEIKPEIEFVENSAVVTTSVTDQIESENGEEIISSERTEISEATTRLAWIILTSALILITVLCAYLAWDIVSDRQKINQLTQLYPDTLSTNTQFDVPVKKDSINAQPDNTPVTQQIVKTDTIKKAVNENVKKPVIHDDNGPACYVVVGAFSNQENVTRMVQRLERLGYKSAQIKGGSLTRVAISTSCDTENLQKVLNEARSGINPESWIY